MRDDEWYDDEPMYPDNASALRAQLEQMGTSWDGYQEALFVLTLDELE